MGKKNLWDFYGGVPMVFSIGKINHDISMGGNSMGFEMLENQFLWGVGMFSSPVINNDIRCNMQLQSSKNIENRKS